MNTGLMLVAFVVIYIGALSFFLIKSHKKEQKEKAELNARMVIGARVETISGLRGTVCELEDRDVIVDFSCDPEKPIRTRMVRAGVKKVLD